MNRLFTRYAASLAAFSLILSLTLGFSQAKAVGSDDYVITQDGDYEVKGGACSAIHEYPLKDLPEVASRNSDRTSHIRIQYWSPVNPDLISERETALRTEGIPGGRFLVNEKGLEGFVWEFGPSCSDGQIWQDIEDSIDRRLEGGVNTIGWADKDEVMDLFSPAVGGTISGNGSGTNNTIVAGTTKMQGCPASTLTNHKLEGGLDGFEAVGPAIVNAYWPGESSLTPSFGTEQVSFMVPAGQTVTVISGLGEVYEYEDNAACVHNIPIEMKADNYRDVQLESLAKEDLVTVTKTEDSKSA